MKHFTLVLLTGLLVFSTPALAQEGPGNGGHSQHHAHHHHRHHHHKAQ